MAEKSSKENALNSGGCPMKDRNRPNNVDAGASSPFRFWSSWSRSPNESVLEKGLAATGCPRTAAADTPLNTTTTPSSLEEAARYAQTPQPDQRVRLSTSRQESSIPRGDILQNGDVEAKNPLPHHQHDSDASRWVYPSEQQLYNAMRRKGWQNIPEDSIPTVLKIHNTINERTWQQIQNWEGVYDEHYLSAGGRGGSSQMQTSPSDLKLTRFQGRPRDISPKAFLFSYVLRMYEPPFDRHDWYVYNPRVHGDRNSQQQQRYVIDYYMIEQRNNPNLPPIPYIDARPALDNPRALFLRGERLLQETFPGITWYLRRLRKNFSEGQEEKP